MVSIRELRSRRRRLWDEYKMIASRSDRARRLRQAKLWHWLCHRLDAAWAALKINQEEIRQCAR